jgi:hypothetical protein
VSTTWTTSALRRAAMVSTWSRGKKRRAMVSSRLASISSVGAGGSVGDNPPPDLHPVLQLAVGGQLVAH